jgi:Mg-chelatase subunit ChlD
MKTITVAVLFLATLVSGFVRAAEAKADKPQIEVCFVLDTTGSMTGLIEGAKAKIWSIANQIIKADPTPEIRIGLIGYRDREDQYITRIFDLTDDLDAIFTELQKFKADGGGDKPESVNQALAEGIGKISWSKDQDILKIMFLVGDAPPHMDYENDTRYMETCEQAAKAEIIINTVQCGRDSETEETWKEIARLAEGKYVAIEQSGGMAAVSTPMDEKIAELSRELGGTAIAYGTPAARAEVRHKVLAAESAPTEAVADRAFFMARSSGAGVVSGEGELIDALSSGRVKIEDLDEEELPEEMKKMNEEEKKAYVEGVKVKREKLAEELKKLTDQRDEYIALERKRTAETMPKDSFDQQVAEMIRNQAARKGFKFE